MILPSKHKPNTNKHKIWGRTCTHPPSSHSDLHFLRLWPSQYELLTLTPNTCTLSPQGAVTQARLFQLHLLLQAETNLLVTVQMGPTPRTGAAAPQLPHEPRLNRLRLTVFVDLLGRGGGGGRRASGVRGKGEVIWGRHLYLLTLPRAIIFAFTFFFFLLKLTACHYSEHFKPSLGLICVPCR